LEAFYIALGSQTLGSLVQEDLRLGHPAEKQASAVKLRSHVLERSKLFLHEYSRQDIKHDSRWLEKNLSVQVVSSISVRRSLRGHTLSHTEKRSAACTKSTDRQNGYTLFIIAGNWDTYQISLSLCKLLLDRPNQSAYLTFESFLNLNLLQLRSRGYNVERILRAKAAEARIAEEERRKQLEAEQQQIKDQEQQWRQQSQVVPAAAARQERSMSEETPMPGAFGADSPENSPAPKSSPKIKSRGLFSGLTKRLGINSSSIDEAQEQLQNFLGGPGPSDNHQHDNPPTYDEASKGTVPKPGGGTEQVSSPHAVQQNLLNAIQSSRAHDSSKLFSPPTTQTIKEQATYCDATPSQNITFLADASNGTRIFVSKTLASPTTFLAQNVTALNSFAVMLDDVSDVYSLPRKAMHIFYDESGGTIAFNSNGSIFCNFRFFAQLHQKKMEGGVPEGRTEAGAYWWIVVAHELAHNLVKEHNAEHSFYTYAILSNLSLDGN
jgi:Protein of unknown function (DUF3684)